MGEFCWKGLGPLVSFEEAVTANQLTYDLFVDKSELQMFAKQQNQSSGAQKVAFGTALLNTYRRLLTNVLDNTL